MLYTLGEGGQENVPFENVDNCEQPLIHCKCTFYVTSQKLIIIIRWRSEQTWVTLLRCIHEPNFIKICAAVWEVENVFNEDHLLKF